MPAPFTRVDKDGMAGMRMWWLKLKESSCNHERGKEGNPQMGYADNKSQPPSILVLLVT